MPDLKKQLFIRPGCNPGYHCTHVSCSTATPSNNAVPPVYLRIPPCILSYRLISTPSRDLDHTYSGVSKFLCVLIAPCVSVTPPPMPLAHLSGEVQNCGSVVVYSISRARRPFELRVTDPRNRYNNGLRAKIGGHCCSRTRGIGPSRKKMPVFAPSSLVLRAFPIQVPSGKRTFTPHPIRRLPHRLYLFT